MHGKLHGFKGLFPNACLQQGYVSISDRNCGATGSHIHQILNLFCSNIALVLL